MLTRPLCSACFSGILTLLVAALACGDSVRLDQLDLGRMTSGWGKPQKNRSVTGTALSVGKTPFEHGVGTHANSECPVLLDGKSRRFTAKVGVDDNARDARASIEFVIYGDDRVLWRSGVCRWGEKPRECRVDLAGITLLELAVTDTGDGVDFDHADWAEASIEFDGTPPKVALPPVPEEDRVILTPPPPPEPRINGPRVYGVRPGSPLLYRIPCTGQRPIQFKAEGLPEGLTLDPGKGILAGKVARAGTYRTTFTATNARGSARREFRIVVGDRLALTPPMGWNSWYIHYNRVSDRVMRQAADQMIATGMADYGYQYVNIDDCWMKKRGDEPYRDSAGAVLPNAGFPDMKGMAEYIHGKGLKAGLYTSPGPWTCAGYVGAFGHEAADARRFAEWGFDFLKYDWCSYRAEAPGVAGMKKPYQIISEELRKLDRDIVLNLCQYGMGEVWKWGGEVGHCWRTTGDLGLERGAALPGFYRIGLSNAQHWQYARPGAWNDPDYILIGWVGDAHGMGEGKPTALTPSEQYAYMAMWSLMAAPLVFSGDMAKLDPFTLGVLCNHEVIEVNQDPLGKQARILRHNRRELVLVKDLEDGSKAVGLFNLGAAAGSLQATWSDLGVKGPQRLRDLWRQKDLGTMDGKLETTVSRHGVILLRLSPIAAVQ